MISKYNMSGETDMLLRDNVEHVHIHLYMYKHTYIGIIGINTHTVKIYYLIHIP